jgi:hypothetical protein
MSQRLWMIVPTLYCEIRILHQYIRLKPSLYW